MRVQFPFSAIVGQDDLKTALLVNAVDPRIGGVLVRGERGTAKSTAARALASLLPPEQIWAGSAFRCGPGDEEFDVCAPGEVVPVRPSFVDLPIGASEEGVTGTLDLERTLSSGTRQFEPGLLAAAHRGVLYIDEVNLLPDHLVDLLLDVASSGVNLVERDGISVRHPSRFLFVGTMNPEEGDLRPQFIDRFGLSVTVRAPLDVPSRMEIVRRRLAFDDDPAVFVANWAHSESDLEDRVRRARSSVRTILLNDGLVEYAVSLSLAANTEGLRADVTIIRCAAALAALDDREEAFADDVVRAAALALGHREADSQKAEREPPPRPRPRDSAPADAGAPPPTDEPNTPANADPDAPDAPKEQQDGSTNERQEEPAATAALQIPAIGPGQRRRRLGDHHSGIAQSRRGPVVGVRRLDAWHRSLAVLATLQASAMRGLPLTVRPRDIRVTRRTAAAKRLVVFLVDTSGSMGSRRRMALTKGALIGAVQERYERRELSALITFSGTGVRVLAAPTRNVDRAMSELEGLRTGGRTPLVNAVRQTLEVIRRWSSEIGDPEVLLVIATDGRAALDDVGDLHEQMRRAVMSTLVLDTEAGPIRLGLARRLAAAIGAEYRVLSDATRPDRRLLASASPVGR